VSGIATSAPAEAGPSTPASPQLPAPGVLEEQLDGFKALFGLAYVAFVLGAPGTSHLYLLAEPFFSLVGFETALLCLRAAAEGGSPLGGPLLLRARALLLSLLASSLLAAISVLTLEPMALAGKMLPLTWYSVAGVTNLAMLADPFFPVPYAANDPYYGIAALCLALQGAMCVAVVICAWHLMRRRRLSLLGVMLVIAGAACWLVSLAAASRGYDKTAYLLPFAHGSSFFLGAFAACLVAGVRVPAKARAMVAGAAYAALAGHVGLFWLGPRAGTVGFQEWCLASAALASLSLAALYLVPELFVPGRLRHPLPPAGRRLVLGAALASWPVALFASSYRFAFGAAALAGLRVAVLAAGAVAFELVRAMLRGRLSPRLSFAGVGVLVVGSCLAPVLGLVLLPAPSQAGLGLGVPTLPSSLVYEAAPVALVGDESAAWVSRSLQETSLSFGQALESTFIARCSVLGLAWFREGQAVDESGAGGACLGQVARLEAALSDARPAVAYVWLCRDQVIDLSRDEGRTWEHIGQPATDAQTEQALSHYLGLVASFARHVVVIPCVPFESGIYRNGEPYEQDDPARVARFNYLLYEAARRTPHCQVVAASFLVGPGGGPRWFDRAGGVLGADGASLTDVASARLARQVLALGLRYLLGH
jgi:hypothetical protein